MQFFVIVSLLFVTACSANLTSGKSSNATISTKVPTSTATPIAGGANCHPASTVGHWKSADGPPEIQGKAQDAELWALFFAEAPVKVKTEVKIVWRMTGRGDFAVAAQGPEGQQIKPVWGPEAHSGSNWEHPGGEWGTGFNFPVTGCWTLHATLSEKGSGDIWIQVV